MSHHRAPVRLFAPALLAAAALASHTLAEDRVLYSNGNPSIPADTGLLFTIATSSGVFAPSGSQWSEVQAIGSTEGNASAGFSNVSLAGSGYRFADNFTVPPGQGWTISHATFFVYSPAYALSTPPINGLTIRIWSGRPGDVGSVVIFGDTSVNRFAGGQVTDYYRIFSTRATPITAPDLSRRIWTVDASFSGIHLDPGTYWLDWQSTPSSPTTEIFSPSVTLGGSRGPGGANARQMTPLPPPATEGPWVTLTDPGKPIAAADVPQELPFLLFGTDVPAPCLADITGVGGPPAAPDQQLTVDDIIAFVNAYGDGNMLADVTDIGNSGNGPDGQITVDDIIAFINNFGEGCTF